MDINYAELEGCTPAYVAACNGHVNVSLFSLNMELTLTRRTTMDSLQFMWLVNRGESTALHYC